MCSDVKGYFYRLFFINQLRAVILSEVGFGVLFQFPIGDLAFFAGSSHPFVTDPAGGAAILGIADHKSLAAMGRDFRVFAFIADGTDPMQRAVTGRPKFDFFQKAEKIHMFTIVSSIALRSHNINS